MAYLDAMRVVFASVMLAVLVGGSRPLRRRHLRRRYLDPATQPPNIILFITDDQDVELGSMDYMPKSLKVFRSGGAEFRNGFVTTPVCCPSRSSMLSGKYVHNHNVWTNGVNCSSAYWRARFEHSTFNTFVQNAGYTTGYFGKYLNDYTGSYVPPGWDGWAALQRNSRYYNYTISYHGRSISHGDDYARDYLTDLIANDSLAFFARQRSRGKKTPVFMVLSFPAPHGPEDVAPQYSTAFANYSSHRTTSWNVAPNPDKQWLLRQTGKMEPIHIAFTDALHRRRLQTLLSVDDAVEKVFNELKRRKELSNTYMMYTSDHGYHLGQFGLVKGKSLPYDFDLKVPFFIRGPGIPRRLKIWKPVSNIDIGPTLIDLAGGVIPEQMDGLSLVPLLRHERLLQRGVLPRRDLRWRETLLVERGVNQKKRGRWKDSWKMQADRYKKMRRIKAACRSQRYRAPCKIFQKWACRRDPATGRKRIFKCRGEVSVKRNCLCFTPQQRATRQPGNRRRSRSPSYADLYSAHRGSYRDMAPRRLLPEPVDSTHGSLSKNTTPHSAVQLHPSYEHHDSVAFNDGEDVNFVESNFFTERHNSLKRYKDFENLSTHFADSQTVPEDEEEQEAEMFDVSTFEDLSDFDVASIPEDLLNQWEQEFLDEFDEHNMRKISGKIDAKFQGALGKAKKLSHGSLKRPPSPPQPQRMARFKQEHDPCPTPLSRVYSTSEHSVAASPRPPRPAPKRQLSSFQPGKHLVSTDTRMQMFLAAGGEPLPRSTSPTPSAKTMQDAASRSAANDASFECVSVGTNGVKIKRVSSRGNMNEALSVHNNQLTVRSLNDILSPDDKTERRVTVGSYGVQITRASSRSRLDTIQRQPSLHEIVLASAIRHQSGSAGANLPQGRHANALMQPQISIVSGMSGATDALPYAPGTRDSLELTDIEQGGTMPRQYEGVSPKELVSALYRHREIEFAGSCWKDPRARKSLARLLFFFLVLVLLFGIFYAVFEKIHHPMNCKGSVSVRNHGIVSCD